MGRIRNPDTLYAYVERAPRSKYMLHQAQHADEMHIQYVPPSHNMHMRCILGNDSSATSKNNPCTISVHIYTDTMHF